MAETKLGILAYLRDEATRGLKRLEGGIGSLGNKMTVGITLPVLAAAGALSKMAMDVTESENLFSVSMGAMSDDARAFSEGLRNQLGLNAVEVRKSVSTFNVMFNSMGLTEAASYGMSKGLTQLSYDLSSFYNLSSSDAFDKIRAGIMGETEPLRALGIVVSDTTIKNWALTRGLISQGQEMSESQKIIARYGTIMEATSKAQGDLARTLDSPTNQLRMFQNRLREAGQEAGQVFLPVLSKALLWINNEGMPRAAQAVKRFGESWGEMSEQSRQKVLITAGLLVAGGPLLKGLTVGIQAVGLLANAFGLIPIKARLAIAGAVGALFVFRDKYADFMESNARITLKFGELLQRLPGMAGAAFETMKAGMGLMEMSQNIRSLGVDVGDLAGKALTTLDPAFTQLVDSVAQIGEEGMKSLDQWTDSAEQRAARQGKLWADFASDTRESMQGAMQPPPNMDDTLKQWWSQTGDAIKDTGEKAKVAKEKAAELGMSIGDLTGALVQMHPATSAAAAVVQVWQGRIEAVNMAIQANQDQIKAAQAEYGRMGERLSDLNRQLSEQQRRLTELSQPKLTGMGEMGMQIAAVQDALKRFDLAETMGRPIEEIMAQFPLLTKGAAGFLASLGPLSREGLEGMLKQLQALQGVRFDEQLRLLGNAAEDSSQEMTFKDALKGIRETKGRIGELTGEISAQEAAMRSQQAVIGGLQAVSENLNRTLAEYQKQLQGAQANQQLVTQSLQMAFQWLLQDRQKFTELGEEGERIAGVMDVKTRELLAAITGAASDTTSTSSATLAKMVANYQRDMGQALLEIGGVQGALNAIPTEITTVHTTIHRDVYEGAGGGGTGGGNGLPYAGSFAGSGFVPGPVGAPALAVVHGGEFIGPAGGGGGNVYITVQVQGSVVAERDLARRIREELTRTNQRTTTGGLFA